LARPRLEPLEDRTLPSGVSWLPLGPAPITGASSITGGMSLAGRVTAIAVDPSASSTIYLGAASGGVWKSTDGGQTWTPKTDQVFQSNGSPVTMGIGAIAIAPSNDQVIYVGTGEANNNGDAIAGQGVLKSTDGANHWTLETGNPGKNEFVGADISTVVVDPRNSDHLFVSVERPIGGIWESKDGGSTWNNLKMTNPNVTNNQPFDSSAASITALVMDPNNPDTLFAAAGWYQGNNYNGVYRSTVDASGNRSAFALAGNFLIPQGGIASTSNQLGRISLAIAASDPNYLYAMVSDSQPSKTGGQNLYEVLRTTNALASDVTTINWQNLPDATTFSLHGQGQYGNVLTVDPTNKDILYAAGYKVWYSPDAGTNSDGSSTWYELSNENGESLQNGAAAEVLHNDQHAFAWIPGTHNLLVGDDGGIFELTGIAANPNQSAAQAQSKLGLWTSVNGNLQITQFYDIALNPQAVAYGAAQDNGVSEFTGNLDWTARLDGDGLGVAVNPTNSQQVYAVNNPGVPNIYSATDGQTFNLIQGSMPQTDFAGGGKFALDPGAGTNGQDLLVFTAEVLDSKGNFLNVHNLYESTDSGRTWNPITTQSGSNWPTANGQSNYFVDAVAVEQVFNPVTLKFQTMILALGGSGGSNVGEVSLDGGAHWTQVANPTGTTERLVFDPLVPSMVYAVTAGKLYEGHISFNWTASPVTVSINWTALPTTGLPAGTAIHSVAIDDRYGRILYAGTDYGVYALPINIVAGVETPGQWYQYGTGLPNVRVDQVVLVPNLNILAAGTYGRGLWETQAGVTAQVVNGVLTVQGDGNNDDITIRTSPTDSSLVEVVVRGATGLDTVLGTFSDFGRIQVNGGGGDTTLTIDYSYGLPASDVRFVGGAGTNTLYVVDQSGNIYKQETDTMSDPRGGTIRLYNSFGVGPVIDYSNVNVIDDTTTVNNYQMVDSIPGSGQALGVTDASSPLGPYGPVITGSQTTTDEFGGAMFSRFTERHLNNKNNITVEGPTSSTTFDVTYATAVVPLTLQGQDGQDTFNINYASNINTITVTDSGSAQLSRLNVNDASNVDNVDLNDSGGKPAYTVTSDHIERTGNVASNGPLLINEADDVTIKYSNMGFVTINGGNNGYVYNVQSTAAGTSTTINAGTGKDAVDVIENIVQWAGFAPALAGSLTVNGDGATTALLLDDRYVVPYVQLQPTLIQYLPGPSTYTVDDGYVERDSETSVFNGGPLYVHASSARISYSKLASVTVQDDVAVNDLGNGNKNTLQVFGTGGTNEAVLGVNSRGAQVNIGSPAGGVQFNGSGYLADNGLNTIGTVSVLGNADTTLTVDDTANGIYSFTYQPNDSEVDTAKVTDSSPSYYVTAGQVQRYGGVSTLITNVFTNAVISNTSSTNASTIDYSNIRSLTINGGSVQNTFDVQATAAGIATTINAGTGGDTVNVGSDPVNLPQSILDPIQGAVAVNGTGGNTTVNFNDKGGTPGAAPNQVYNYSLAQNSFSRTGTATVTFAGMATVNLHAANAGGNGFNDLGVSSTAPGTTTNVYAGTGLNEFLVFDINYTLNGIQGALNLHGTGGLLPNNDVVFLNDITNPTGHTYLVSAGAASAGNQSGMVQRFADSGMQNPDTALIKYDGLNAYSVLATNDGRPRAGGNTINVQSQAANLWTIIAAGTGDTVNVGQNGSMANVLGDLRIQSALGQKPTVNLDDSGDSSPRTIDLASDTPYTYLVTGLLPQSTFGRGRVWLQLDPAAPVTIKTGAGATPTNDVFRVHDLTNAPALTLDGGNGSNTLDFSSYTQPANLPANSWIIDGRNHGTVNGLTFSSIGSLIGSPANDTFAFRTGGSLSGKLDGGGGSNTLDYSAYQGDITVNLPRATAAAIAQGIANIQNVTGSIGNDILVGDANPNVLKGGTGRNLIIGGAGADTITGGGGDNILIGGTTSWDMNPTALQDIMHEFLQTYSTDPVTDFNTRVNNIRMGKGTLTGTQFYLQGPHGKLAQTVFDDGVKNTLTHGGGLNWFWIDGADVVNSTNPNDRRDQA
jgi:hypothetical protein